MVSVSILIATSGRIAALEETLGSLCAVELPPDFAVELLLVENGQRAGAELLLSALPNNRLAAVRYLLEPTPGKSRALNLAVAHASGEILVFTDDDVRFPRNWIERLCEPIISGRADAVAGGVRLAPHLVRPWMTRRHRAWLASTDDYLSADAPSEMCGANMAIRRSAFDTVGGFDTEIGPGVTNGGEESLLSCQLRSAGFRLAGALNVAIEHHPDEQRLQYRHWLNAARGKGATRAYLLHHWHHQSIRGASLKRRYLLLKLLLRRVLTGPRSPETEGIPGWELSYVEDAAMYEQYQRERTRTRNYAHRGLRRLVSSSLVVT